MSHWKLSLLLLDTFTFSRIFPPQQGQREKALDRICMFALSIHPLPHSIFVQSNRMM
jgi:hypothetical protein